MIADILLTSVTFVKDVTSIDDNIADKYLIPSMREAQEFEYKHIIGENLYNKLISLVESRDIDLPENINYKKLLDASQYFLAYTSVVEVMQKVSYKVANAGVIKTNDEHVINAERSEIGSNCFYYQSKSDSYCLELQNYVLEHRKEFPELSESYCHKIEYNLHSAASCGLFLGGTRGKILNYHKKDDRYDYTNLRRR